MDQWRQLQFSLYHHECIKHSFGHMHIILLIDHATEVTTSKALTVIDPSYYNIYYGMLV